MSDSVLQQPRMVVNGKELTADEIGTVMAGLTALSKISSALEEARDAGMPTDIRDATAKRHGARAIELHSRIFTAVPVPASDDASPERVRVTVEIDAERQEAFTRMWHEFITSETRHDRAIRARAADRAQGIESLRELAAVAQRDSGQCRYIARLLAGLYNGPRFPFDLTDLRAIDDALFEHAIAVLRLDHHPEKEVHQYFPKGSELWERRIIGAWGLDQATAEHAAHLLAGFLERTEKPELERLAEQIRAWRDAEQRRRDED